jgi:hypothetical protein
LKIKQDDRISIRISNLLKVAIDNTIDYMIDNDIEFPGSLNRSEFIKRAVIKEIKRIKGR